MLQQIVDWVLNFNWGYADLLAVFDWAEARRPVAGISLVLLIKHEDLLLDFLRWAILAAFDLLFNLLLECFGGRVPTIGQASRWLKPNAPDASLSLQLWDWQLGFVNLFVHKIHLALDRVYSFSKFNGRGYVWLFATGSLFHWFVVFERRPLFRQILRRYLERWRLVQPVSIFDWLERLGRLSSWTERRFFGLSAALWRLFIDFLISVRPLTTDTVSISILLLDDKVRHLLHLRHQACLTVVEVIVQET